MTNDVADFDEIVFEEPPVEEPVCRCALGVLTDGAAAAFDRVVDAHQDMEVLAMDGTLAVTLLIDLTEHRATLADVESLVAAQALPVDAAKLWPRLRKPRAPRS